jgi:hypothetical protein
VVIPSQDLGLEDAQCIQVNIVLDSTLTLGAMLVEMIGRLDHVPLRVVYHDMIRLSKKDPTLVCFM